MSFIYTSQKMRRKECFSSFKLGYEMICLIFLHGLSIIQGQFYYDLFYFYIGSFQLRPQVILQTGLFITNNYHYDISNMECAASPIAIISSHHAKTKFSYLPYLIG